jgi:hypothetical protein
MLVNTNGVIREILKEAEKLDPLEQQKLLVKLRRKRLKRSYNTFESGDLAEQQALLKKKIAKYLSKSKAPIADYNTKKIKPPTMEQIDKWKHESRIKK